MNRRQVFSASAAALFAPASPAREGVSSKKKGWAGGNEKFHKLFGVNWYYTWSPKTRPSSAAEFVPMIKGSWSLKQSEAVRKMKGNSSLLGFNEPERQKQGNISVAEAIRLWPRLVELAEQGNLRLGSPAPSSDRAGMEWLKSFMEEAARKDLRIDFLAVHWYRGRDPEAFESFVEGLVREYRIPIWITEFNGWSGPVKEHLHFLERALRFLERSRDVERYAYFNPGPRANHSLVDQDGGLTELGKLYQSA